MALDTLRLDDGRTFRGNQAGAGVRFIGQEQNRLRRAEEQARNRASFHDRGTVGPLRTHSGGMGSSLRSPMWDAYFGLMQARENATGGKFNVQFEDWGNQKYLDEPSGRTYAPAAGEIAPGLRGRPSQALADLTGQDPSQRGFYTPGEFRQARTGLERAFRGLR